VTGRSFPSTAAERRLTRVLEPKEFTCPGYPIKWHSLPAVPGALAQRSRSVWRGRSERAITYAKDARAASAVVKAIELDGGKASRSRRTLPTSKPSGAVEKTIATFDRLDVLVNNAGTAIPKTFEETTLEEMDRVIDINLRGTLAVTQAALKHMKSGGRIIMIGSAVGERAVAPGWCRTRHQGGREDVCPELVQRAGEPGDHGQQRPAGPHRHRLNPAAGDWAVPQKAATALRRYGHVDEIAAMVAFVAGPESSYITGANLTVDGGMKCLSQRTHQSLLLRPSSDLRMSKAVDQMVVDHPHGLHVRIHDLRTTKVKPRPFRSLLRASD